MSYRLRDIVLATIGLIILAPVFICILLLLSLTQPRIFFIQVRPGLNEQPFRLIKFSTLYDAKAGEDEYDHLKARLTPIGKYLRRYSLDEIPQLINVLKGDMSLVGPRPLLMEYLPLYTPEEKKRHQVRPGITGWAQVHGRNILSFKEKFAYDIHYVTHRSHKLDLLIIWRTINKIFAPTGVFGQGGETVRKYDGTN